MGAPRAGCSTLSGLAIANVLRTGVQLNGDSLHPAHVFSAVDAVRVVSGGHLVVVVDFLKKKVGITIANLLETTYSSRLGTQVGQLVIASFRQSCSGHSGFKSLHRQESGPPGRLRLVVTVTGSSTTPHHHNHNGSFHGAQALR